jgi:CHRD domain
MKQFIRPLLAGMAIAATVACLPAFAEIVTMKADLKGASEVPPTTSPATGSLTATYDTASKKLDWKGTISGLTGPATAAHFHGPAEAGKNAGVLIPVTGVTTGAFEGSATLTDDQAKAVTAGQTYFNIHTEANKGGEVRGQVTK